MLDHLACHLLLHYFILLLSIVVTFSLHLLLHFCFFFLSVIYFYFFFFFFFQAEDGIRVLTVTGVQTCALPILDVRQKGLHTDPRAESYVSYTQWPSRYTTLVVRSGLEPAALEASVRREVQEIGRASCRERV